jgi:ABC-type antimicrobial peptide transport system ATPase subunit
MPRGTALQQAYTVGKTVLVFSMVSMHRSLELCPIVFKSKGWVNLRHSVPLHDHHDVMSQWAYAHSEGSAWTFIIIMLPSLGDQFQMHCISVIS